MGWLSKFRQGLVRASNPQSDFGPADGVDAVVGFNNTDMVTVVFPENYTHTLDTVQNHTLDSFQNYTQDRRSVTETTHENRCLRFSFVRSVRLHHIDHGHAIGHTLVVGTY